MKIRGNGNVEKQWPERKSKVLTPAGSGTTSSSDVGTFSEREILNSLRVPYYSEIILTLHVPLSIGFFGGRKQSNRIDINRMKKYFDLSEEDIIDYACRINSNYKDFNEKHHELNISRAKLAATYQQLISNSARNTYSIQQ